MLPDYCRAMASGEGEYGLFVFLMASVPGVHTSLLFLAMAYV